MELLLCYIHVIEESRLSIKKKNLRAKLTTKSTKTEIKENPQILFENLKCLFLK